jgi:hypothetical protein
MNVRPLAVLALATATLAGCKDDPVDPMVQVSGTYTLQTVNGSALPVIVYQDAEERDELLAGTLIMQSNGTWTETFTVRTTFLETGGTSTTTEADAGTYTVDGNTINFTSNGFNYIGSRSGNQITYSLFGFTLVWQK